MDNNMDFDAMMENAQNVITDNRNFQYTQTFNFRIPKPEEQVPINVSAIVKIKKECDIVRKKKFSLSELMLSLAMLFWGAFFSALISGVNYEFSVLSILFYTVSPLLGIVGIILYFVFKGNNFSGASDLIRVIDDVLPTIENEETEVK